MSQSRSRGCGWAWWFCPAGSSRMSNCAPRCTGFSNAIARKRSGHRRWSRRRRRASVVDAEQHTVVLRRCDSYIEENSLSRCIVRPMAGVAIIAPLPATPPASVFASHVMWGSRFSIARIGEPIFNSLIAVRGARARPSADLFRTLCSNRMLHNTGRSGTWSR
jgi:hypothetical protein